MIREIRWLALLALGLTSCSQKAPVSSGVRVVTSVAPITNIVHNVGGKRIQLTGIIPEGSDSHTFEPTPADARMLSEADLILLNGLRLETPTEKLAAANLKKGAAIFPLGDHTLTPEQYIYDFSFPKEKGNPNPHLWMNVAYARRYAELAEGELEKIDSAGSGSYRENLKLYEVQLDRLDVAIQTAVATIPAPQRKLVTYHDSFAYFAPRYGMTVIGAVQPSDFKEPSPRDLASMVDQLKRENVPAIFGSEVYPSKVIDQLGKEARVKYVSTLRDDDLPGAMGAPEHTYVGMMVEDVRTMVTALGGSAQALDNFSSQNTCQP